MVPEFVTVKVTGPALASVELSWMAYSFSVAAMAVADGDGDAALHALNRSTHPISAPSVVRGLMICYSSIRCVACGYPQRPESASPSGTSGGAIRHVCEVQWAPSRPRAFVRSG